MLAEQKLYHNSCLGVVLAGGLSSRMGQEKALLKRQQHRLKQTQQQAQLQSAQQQLTQQLPAQTMLNFTLEQLKQTQVDHVVISGKKFGLADAIDNNGPIGGIITVLEKYRPKALLISPVDLPLIDHHCLNKLKIVGELSQQACYYQDNFLPLYLPVSGFLEQFLADYQQAHHLSAHSGDGQKNVSKKGPSIKQLLASIPCKAITADRPEQLFNSNTPQEWQQACAKLTLA